MDLPSTVSQKMKKISKFNKGYVSLMLAKHNDNVNSWNEVIAKNKKEDV